MLGEPGDVAGECNARLFIGDNYGDNTATMRCQLPLKHGGLHREQFEHEGGPVTITWAADERERCDHGCGQWEHDHGDPEISCPRDAEDHEYSDCGYCHPGEEGASCQACGKIYYYARGHQRHCQPGTGRPEDAVACPACDHGPGVSCEGPSSHPSRLLAHRALEGG